MTNTISNPQIVTRERLYPPPDPSQAPASLVALETTQQAGLLLDVSHVGTYHDAESWEPPSLDEQRFWHSSWRRNRARVWAALQAAHVGRQRLLRFAYCGASSWVERCGDDIRISGSRCRDRWCQTCQRLAVQSCRNELVKAFRPGGTRMIVLTLKHSVNPLHHQIRFIRRCFQELRRRPIWKRNVAGGAAIIEVKVGDDGLWHPHLHILCTGRYIDQYELSREWLAITNHSSIVHVSMCGTEEQAIHEVTKYITMPVGVDLYREHDRMIEAIGALNGVRIMSTFGTWKGIKLRHTPDKADRSKWVGLGRLDAIMQQRDEQSLAIRQALIRKYPALEQAYPLFFGFVDLPPP